MLGWLLGCGATPDAPAPHAEPASETLPALDAPQPAPPPVPPPPDPSRAPPAGAPTVTLRYRGVGPLHQRYFGDEMVVASFTEALGTCLAGPVTLQVHWDEDAKLGTITLASSPSQLQCSPTAGEGLDLTPLLPVGKALAHYRDQVAGRFDLRVASFRTHLAIGRCTLRLGGQFPPDGSSFDACVDLGGERACLPDRDRGHLRFDFADPSHDAALAACLRGAVE